MALISVEAKKSNGREALLMSLYQDVFPVVAGFVHKMGGSFEEAKDVFQDALMIYFEKTAGTAPAFKHSEKAYLFGISRHLWYKKYRETGHHVPLDQLGIDDASNPEDVPYQEVSSARLLRLLQTAGQKCMELLSAFYYEKIDMETLAVRFGFSGPRSATVQKFKCLEKVKETVKEKSISYEDILE